VGRPRGRACIEIVRRWGFHRFLASFEEGASFQPAARSPAAVNARFAAAIPTESVCFTCADVASRLRARERRSGGGSGATTAGQ